MQGLYSKLEKFRDYSKNLVVRVGMTIFLKVAKSYLCYYEKEKVH